MTSHHIISRDLTPLHHITAQHTTLPHTASHNTTWQYCITSHHIIAILHDALHMSHGNARHVIYNNDDTIHTIQYTRYITHDTLHTIHYTRYTHTVRTLTLTLTLSLFTHTQRSHSSHTLTLSYSHALDGDRRFLMPAPEMTEDSRSERKHCRTDENHSDYFAPN